MLYRLAEFLKLNNCNIYLIPCGATINNDEKLYTDNDRLKIIFKNMDYYYYEYDRIIHERWVGYSKAYIPELFYGCIISKAQWWHPFDKKEFSYSVSRLSKAYKYIIEIDEPHETLPQKHNITYIYSREIEEWLNS